MPIWGHAKAPRESVVGLFRGQQEICFSQEQVKGREAGVGAGVDKVGWLQGVQGSKAPRSPWSLWWVDQKPFKGSEQGRDVTSLAIVTSVLCWGQAWSLV